MDIQNIPRTKSFHGQKQGLPGGKLFPTEIQITITITIIITITIPISTLLLIPILIII